MINEGYEYGETSEGVSRALRARVLQRLKNAEGELRSIGVLHAGVFGSVARGEARDDSDVDILVDLDPTAHIGLFKFVGLQQRLAEIMECEVDVIGRKGLRPGRGSSILRDLIEVF